MARPQDPSASPWVVEWSHRYLTVLMAQDADDARSKAKARQCCVEDGWWDLDAAEIRRVRPVGALELNVASRVELNRPKFGFIRVDGRSIAWSGPHDGLPAFHERARGCVLTGRPRSDRVDSTKLWSYVWSHRELVLFTAPSFDTACHRASHSFPASTRGAVADLIEPMPRFELQLAESRAGHGPTCYRLWIDGNKVGWPPTEDQEPYDSPPPTPLAAEARLPIPMYDHTYVYGPGPRKKEQRRFDVPWPGGRGA